MKKTSPAVLLAALATILVFCIFADVSHAVEVPPPQTVPYHCLGEVYKCTCDSPLDCWALGRSDLCRDNLDCSTGDLCTCTYQPLQAKIEPKDCKWLCRLWGKRIELKGCSTSLDGRSHADVYVTTKYRFWFSAGFSSSVEVSEGPCS